MFSVYANWISSTMHLSAIHIQNHITNLWEILISIKRNKAGHWRAAFFLLIRTILLISLISCVANGLT